MKETGLRAVGHPNPSTDIKLNGKTIGHINPPSWETKDDKWSIALAIKKPATKEEPADWKWIFFKARFDSEEDGRTWIMAHFDSLKSKYQLHQFEDYV